MSQALQGYFIVIMMVFIIHSSITLRFAPRFSGSVDVLPTLSGWIQTGGRINAYKAISFLRIPTNLTATAASTTRISLTWSDNASCEKGYKIERKIGEGTWTDMTPIHYQQIPHPLQIAD